MAKPAAKSRKKTPSVAQSTRRNSASTTTSDGTKQRQPLPAAWQLTSIAWRRIWRYRRLFIAITLIYGLFNLVLVQGFAGNSESANLKTQLSQAANGQFGSLSAGLTAFFTLLGSAGNGSSNTTGAYQFFLVVVVSLALIWALRQTAAGAVVRMRDAFYNGMYPLIPFILVLLCIGLQLLPLLIGSGLYSLVVTNNIAVNAGEKLAWGLFGSVLAALSFYLISSSIFALYIVTLPDMTPRKALRSARDLVKSRRWTVLRKLLFLPLVLLTTAAIIMLPIIIWLTPLSQWIFFVLTMFALVAIHAYGYTLYRELLDE